MQARSDVASVALIALSVIRIVATFTVYSAAVDEPMHISAALQLYTQHDYTYQPVNPPLPRLVFGLAPWLGGMQFDPKSTMEAQLSHVFHSNHHYKTNLVLARSGNLLFFVIAAVAVWWWARRELGANGGLVAVALFVLQPVVAGYAGLVTHDIAAVTGVAVSLLAFARWLDVPSTRAAMVFGAAYAFAVLCKFCDIGYVPAACLAMYLVRAMRDAETRRAWRHIAPSFAAALATSVVLVWIGYGFTTHWFFAGIHDLVWFDRMDFFGYAFGRIEQRGWWWYFPAAVALKSTIASLVLGFCAFLARQTRVAGEALAAALAILAVSMTSHLDLGVRYVLPLYAPLSVAGAAVALAMLHHHRLRIAAAVLLAWHAVASIVAIPDAFPYFNELAARRPWLYLLDSNLDWGQDILRLKRVVRAKKIDRLAIVAMGVNDYASLGFPPTSLLNRDVPTQGWVAISEQPYWFFGYPWLRGRPYERVGKSIRLYYIP
jgi:4-amino-4-deoxy-L-arabinose transferase-like glycosyltransferase